MKTLFSAISKYFNRIFYAVVVFVCLLAQGCLELEQELIINQDGSGKLKAQYILGESFTQMVEMAEGMKESVGGKTTTKAGFVLNEADLKEKFQGEGIKIEHAEFEKKEGKQHISYTVTFLNIKNLLETKALGEQKVSLYRDESGNLAFQNVGIETLGPEGAEAEMMKELTEAFKANFILTLPGKVLESNADSTEGATLTWQYTKDKLKPEVMTAVCEGTGLAFLAKLPAEPKKKAAAYVYDPTGKRDPFRPFILEVKRPKETVTKLLQPLQRYEISQLKLVGIIWQAKNPRAIFEDAAGKGYIVSKGSYIGKNEGRVTDIFEDEVVIIEKSTDILGETKIKDIKVRLHEKEAKSK